MGLEVGAIGYKIANKNPAIVIHGAAIADAKPTVATLPICRAILEASPAFCLPTSNEIVRPGGLVQFHQFAAPIAQKIALKKGSRLLHQNRLF